MNKKYYDNLPEDLKNIISIVSDKMLNKSYILSENIYECYLSKAKNVSKEVYILSEKEFDLWNNNICDYWKTVTRNQPELFDIIMEIKQYREPTFSVNNE